jgi:predicted transcriptional regulator
VSAASTEYHMTAR